MKPLHFVCLLVCLLATPALAQDAENAVIAKEKSLWVAWSNKDGEAFRSALTEDSVQVITGEGEIKGRDEIVRTMASPECALNSYSLGKINARRLAPDIIILSYSATQDGICGKRPLPTNIQATAIYVRQKGQWLESHYQETPTK